MENLEQKEIGQKEKKPILVACYGTLRVGHGNWRYLLDGRSKHVGTFKTEPKFTMYGKGAGFPVVVDKGTTEIEYDLFEVNEGVLSSLNGLEGCTGITGDPRNWYDIIDIPTPKGEAKMYVMHTGRGEGSIIESGNWNNK